MNCYVKAQTFTQSAILTLALLIKCLARVSPSKLTSSHFIEFEFHWASKFRVWTHIELKCYPFFEFRFQFDGKVIKFWPEYFEYSKFYHVQIPLYTNYQLKLDQAWNLSAKTHRVFEFRVACSSISIFKLVFFVIFKSVTSDLSQTHFRLFMGSIPAPHPPRPHNFSAHFRGCFSLS